MGNMTLSDIIRLAHSMAEGRNPKRECFAQSSGCSTFGAHPNTIAVAALFNRRIHYGIGPADERFVGYPSCRHGRRPYSQAGISTRHTQISNPTNAYPQIVKIVSGPTSPQIPDQDSNEHR